ncbi:MAG: 23S rRNA methyltransferase [Betaproteobacteria bacterium RIFCSPLOWO2_12_FULL_63_13]|nr:MAG: 23S rRNA methyltransferase [Betaproteobacteria bacterium RIFCSPLOWO2_12_FULL_63_13]
MRVLLKPGRERSLAHRHPWIFSGAIDKLSGAPESGDTVRVSASDGRFLAWAAWSPRSQIRARVWSFDEREQPDDDFFRRRVERALARRRMLAPESADGLAGALRLVHCEADGLPGLIVDRYADTLVMQVLSAGIERWRDLLADALIGQTGCARIYERSDAEVRELEGLPARSGVLRGDAPPAPLEIVEHGLRYAVDIPGGQKTGFYLDQRDNRRRIRELAAGREMLNGFCYTGGFSIAALAGGASSVVSVDSSGAALELARRNARANGFEGPGAEWIEADVFRYLRDARGQGRRFDLVVLDPPKLAPTEKHAPAAARAYKDINLNALKLLRPGGLLATFSCSGGVSADLFQKIVAGAAVDAGASATLLERYSAAPDHPVLLEFPQGEYLKGLLVRRN